MRESVLKIVATGIVSIAGASALALAFFEDARTLQAHESGPSRAVQFAQTRRHAELPVRAGAILPPEGLPALASSLRAEMSIEAARARTNAMRAERPAATLHDERVVSPR